jgi:hypothetical protein
VSGDVCDVFDGNMALALIPVFRHACMMLLEHIHHRNST